MTPAATAAAPLAARIDEIADHLQPSLLGEAGPADLAPLREALGDLAADCRRSRPGLARVLARLAVLTELWECRAAEPGDAAGEIGVFCMKALAQLARGEARGDDGDEIAGWILEQSSASWGDYLSLLEDEVPPPASHGLSLHEIDLDSEREERDDTAPEPDPDEPPAIDTQALLRLFGAAPSVPPKALPPERPDEPVPAKAVTPRRAKAALAFVIPPLPRGLDLDDEIREAFLADATDLFERIQSLVLELGARGGSPDSLRELGRCFHTLKGAAGSVGLGELSALVHGLEEHLDGASGPLPPSLIEVLHGTLAYIEGILGLLRAGNRAAPPAAETPPAIALVEATPASEMPPGNSTDGSTSAQEGPVRVASARFDELLDVASELIARRRSWMSQAESLKAVAAMARGLRSRMHACLDRLHAAGLGREDRPRGTSGLPARRVDVSGQIRKLGELDDDLAVIAETAMAAATPLADHGDALGRLTMQLWDELQSIRIVPVRGLFQRLARVALDAARVEGRQVDVVMLGDQAGLDRAVQDKAYEPLLHVVRNAVGHGIESPEDRARAGKPAAGKITLEARREGNSLAISVQDDGRGLDHSAIEAKARRLGLVAAGETPSVERLNELIFHSGFSTKDSANAISGRGVGMDVVAREVGLLRGTIELNTERGRGTRMTIRLPGRLALETVMIARVDGQAFAIPVALIEHAQPIEPKDLGESQFPYRNGEIPLADAREILGVAATPWPAWPKLLVVRSAGGPVGLVVDAIEGTEELVIKPLNALLGGHPLISGTSVSASGEVICVLNLSGLHGEANAHRHATQSPTGGQSGVKGAPRPVLVVDDSISVRRVMARHLRTLGLAVEEVSDGQEALGRLREASYSLVVTDLEMPRLDGLGLLSEMRRIASLATIPVIVASTKSDEETQQKVRSLGARAFLPKPVDPAALADVVGGLVPRPDRSAETGETRTAEESWKAR